ncbi:hypothetical protein CDAR_494801 [Caerostris darwini]|uniref:Uncharacterized protein n=1 Tax=Caerostris darwini TaxID=1538125 RepID=A0AAV4MIZ5_9ARAC|nr:hypothetical protein CDAR_494801 [Caerostris darwini]
MVGLDSRKRRGLDKGRSKTQGMRMGVSCAHVLKETSFFPSANGRRRGRRLEKKKRSVLQESARADAQKKGLSGRFLPPIASSRPLDWFPDIPSLNPCLFLIV